MTAAATNIDDGGIRRRFWLKFVFLKERFLVVAETNSKLCRMDERNDMRGDQEGEYAVMRRLRALCPSDMVISSFSGDILILRGGRDSSNWSAFSVTFLDVIYLALPAYMDSAIIRIGNASARSRVAKRCNSLEPEHIIFEVVEDEDWPEGAKTHLIAAGSVKLDIADPASEKRS